MCVLVLVLETVLETVLELAPSRSILARLCVASRTVAHSHVAIAITLV